MKYLIAGLGNIGTEYLNTRHNIGFAVLESMADAAGIAFEDRRYGFVAEYRYKSRLFILLRPSTYVNLSGRAVNYWLQREKIPVSKLLVVCDDLALPFGTLRIRERGSDGGHNGLRNISEVLGTQDYARMRFGIGDDFHPGSQVTHVLGSWTGDEEKELPAHIEKAAEAVRVFGTLGVAAAMNRFNTRKREKPPGEIQ